MSHTCKNCNSIYEGNFCNQCGQSAKTHDINFKYIWQEIRHSLLYIDKGFLYTSKQLLTRPGKTIRDYVDGKRVKHFKPLAYVFVLSTFYAIIAHFAGIETFFNNVKIYSEQTDNQAVRNFEDFIFQIHYWTKEHYAYTSIILLPFYALASYLAFYKLREHYLKHLVLNAYLTGLRTLIFLFFIPLLALISDYNTKDNIEGFRTAIGFFLTFWTYHQYFEKNTIQRNLLQTALSYLLLIAFASAIILSILLYYNSTN